MRSDQLHQPLTTRQREVLEAIKRLYRRQRIMPTQREIAVEMKIKHITCVRDHLLALQRRGWIELTPGRPRSIRLIFRQMRIQRTETGVILWLDDEPKLLTREQLDQLVSDINAARKVIALGRDRVSPERAA